MIKIPIEISARHIHLSRADLDILFGKNYQLTIKKEISQPGQFSAEEQVEIQGSKGTIEKVRIVGPLRKNTQVELSITDCYKLGIDPIIKASGDIQNTSVALIIGPVGKVKLSTGVIVSQRHLHIEPTLAKNNNLKDLQVISIKTSGQRSVIFNNVIVRSREGIDTLSFMLDTDEANAAGIVDNQFGEII